MRCRKTALSCCLVAVVGLATAGCRSRNKKPPPATQPATQAVVLPRNMGTRGVYLDVYQMTVPAGTVSRNDEFWKRVDEQRVDPATYDLLLKNGVRVGVAPVAEWGYFKDVLESENAQTLKGTASAASQGSVLLTMKRNVRSQDVFYLSDQNKLHGRTYDKCDNLLSVSFWADPRRPGELRVSIAPTVRGTRTVLQFKYNGDEREIQEVVPETLYDLNLRVVLPPDGFLVLAPSEIGNRPTSLGHTFLRKEGDAEQKETVLVMVPRMSEREELPGAKADVQ